MRDIAYLGRDGDEFGLGDVLGRVAVVGVQIEAGGSGGSVRIAPDHYRQDDGGGDDEDEFDHLSCCPRSVGTEGMQDRPSLFVCLHRS